MKQLVIISGKGGTGKTVISACLATLAHNKVMVDCDVDAANLYLLLHPEIQQEHSFSGGLKASVDLDQCTGCGECGDVCRFEAIEDRQDGKIDIDPIACEGCAVCSYVCPVEAISMEKNISGKWFISRTDYGPFVHARLGIGEENSGKLVTEVRKKAKQMAEDNNLDWIIIDGPPGIGCPVIASLSGADMALVVTEPSLSGIHDMERVAQVAHHFRIKTACCINKFDLNRRLSDQIENWCQKKSIPVVGRVSFDEVVTKSLIQGLPLTQYSENSVANEIKKIWPRLISLLQTEDS